MEKIKKKWNEHLLTGVKNSFDAEMVAFLLSLEAFPLIGVPYRMYRNISFKVL
jgi:hypothetical protein